MIYLNSPYLACICFSQVIVNYFITYYIILEKINSSKVINNSLKQFCIFARCSLNKGMERYNGICIVNKREILSVTGRPKYYLASGDQKSFWTSLPWALSSYKVYKWLIFFYFSDFLFSDFSKYSTRWHHLVVIRNWSAKYFIILNIFAFSTFSMQSS